MNNSIGTRYIIVVGGYKESLFETLSKLKQDYSEYQDAKFLVLTTNVDGVDSTDDLIVEQTDFSDESLHEIMGRYGKDAIAVLCRGDKYVQYLRKLLPFLPDGVRVSSEESLEIATNKRLMRQYFREAYPEISPAYVSIADASAETIERIGSVVGYPAIIKPASLASSILIQRVDSREELEQALPATLEQVASVYAREGRSEQPEIIVEEFLEGDFYSVDSYVLESGDVEHLPPVGYLPAASMGIDDFFLYKRWLPVDISEDDIREARSVVERAIAAMGLTWSSTHSELIKTARGWRVIEVGPRIGRFRNTMYAAACGVDHGYNDLLVHLGKRPDVSIPKHEQATAYSIYPTTEGILQSIQGLDVLESMEPAIAYQMIDESKVGQPVHFAKNGGHALLEVVLHAQTADEMSVLSEAFESKVKAEVV